MIGESVGAAREQSFVFIWIAYVALYLLEGKFRQWLLPDDVR